jgi:peptide-methionine (R)-S-oxide reductase
LGDQVVSHFLTVKEINEKSGKINASYIPETNSMHMIVYTALFLALMSSCANPDTIPAKNTTVSDTTKTTLMDTSKVVKTDAEWKAELTPEQYRILREKGTEYAFSGEYWDNHDKGIYKCAGCHTVLFTSAEKFESGCGWPSFTTPFDSTTCDYIKDSSHGMTRTEVTCKKCGGHLGHVFDDGPPPTYQRYCINSGSLIFEEAKK